MCKHTDNSVLGELLESIKYMMESKKGKYSLHTYLDIVGEFTDSLILDAEANDNLVFIGGECQVTPDKESKIFCFFVSLYFHDKNGEQVLKEAKRSLVMSKFTSKTIEEIGDGKHFEINRPKEGK